MGIFSSSQPYMWLADRNIARLRGAIFGLQQENYHLTDLIRDFADVVLDCTQVWHTYVQLLLSPPPPAKQYLQKDAGSGSLLYGITPARSGTLVPEGNFSSAGLPDLAFLVTAIRPDQVMVVIPSLADAEVGASYGGMIISSTKEELAKMSIQIV